MKTKRSWLCAIGLHKWRIFGYNSMLCPIPIERCERCGVGQQFEMYGGLTRFSVQEMEMLACDHVGQPVVHDGRPCCPKCGVIVV